LSEDSGASVCRTSVLPIAIRPMISGNTTKSQRFGNNRDAKGDAMLAVVMVVVGCLPDHEESTLPVF
jgi:hypothetical protein